MAGTWFERHLLVALGSALGGVARYAIGGLVDARVGTTFPWGTLVVNVTGCFVLGLFFTAAIDRLALDPRWRLLMGVGFCGGYTTFSTFGWETAGLLEGGSFAFAAANVAGSAVAGITAVYAGAALARWLW